MTAIRSPEGDRSLVDAARCALILGWRSAPLCSVARVVLTLAAAASAPLVAWFSKLLVDELSRGSGAELSRLMSFALAGACVAAAGLMVAQLTTYVTTRHDAAVTLRAESELFGRVCAFVGLRYFEDPDFHDRLMVAEQSASDGPSAVTSLVQDVGRAVVSLIGFLAVVAVVWPMMAGLLLLAAFPGLIAEMKLANRHVEASTAVAPLQRLRFFYRMLLSDQRAAKEVRLFGLGEFFRTRQLAALRGSQDIMVRLAGRTAVVQAALSMLGAAVSGLAIVVVAGRVMRGELTPGDVLLFLAAVAGVQGALSQIIGEVGMASRSLKLFQHYLDVAQAPVEMVSGVRPALRLRHSLRFEDVWFRYREDTPWVLRGVSFELRCGSSLGLVGVNGAGKSTLVKLLCRFYDPERGRILWDGTDLRELSPASLRARLAATFQDFMTYDLTVGENIGVGDLSRLADVAAVRHSASLAGMADTIGGLPRGFDTMLSRVFRDQDTSEPGVTFSGGQWQRIALARSLMRDDADLLVLDEPSSGLDAEAEHRIHQALREFRRGRTSLLISHRLGSLREADHIVVLADGEIVEQGAHDHLMRADGVYARLFMTQARGYHDPEFAAVTSP
jgi:ATP-binding cassette, subfamily B, bacterial